MLSYDAAHWATFLAAAVALNISPGPDMAYILGHTIRGGRRAGVAAMFGVWTGAFGHVLLAALGLSALVATSATAFAVVKWAGVAYLLYIGVQALRSQGGPLAVEPLLAGQRSFLSIVRQGALVDLLNPKVAIFFLAFLPQFVEPGQGPVGLQLMLHGILIIAVAAFFELPLVLMGDRLATRLRENPSIGLWLDRTLGGVLIALGLRLAVSE